MEKPQWMPRSEVPYTLDMQDRPVVVTNLEGQAMTINWGVGNYLKNLRRFDGTGVTNYYGTDGRLLWTMVPGELDVVLWTADGRPYWWECQKAGVVTYDLTNGFDNAGRVNLEWSAAWGRTNMVAWQMDPVGNVTNVAVSNTPVRFAWTFDAAERPVTLAAYPMSTMAGAFQWTYNTNNGLVASVTNGVVGEYLGFDGLDRATNIVWKNAAGTTLRSFAHQFDQAGMITNVARENGGWTAYTYDSLDRLTSEKQYASTGLTYSASWTYDLAGNRTMAVTNGVTNLYSYTTGNRMTNFGSGTLVQYDLAGNTTNLQYSASRKLGLTWDGKYQLTEARTNGVLVEKYDYDPLGRRVRIIAGTVTNRLVYDGPHVVAEYSNNVLARSYAYAVGIDDVRSLTTYGAATNTYFYLKDHLGSVHALVNTNGAVVEQYRYTAWGETTVLSSNGTVLAASAYGNRVMWQGREYSPRTGLYYFRSRYYAPNLGRWLSKDAVGVAAGLNFYQAFVSNPANYLDPFGFTSYLYVTKSHCGVVIETSGGRYRSYDFMMKGQTRIDPIDGLRLWQGTAGKVVSKLMNKAQAQVHMAQAVAVYQLNVSSDDEAKMVRETIRQSVADSAAAPRYERNGVCVQRAMQLISDATDNVIAFPDVWEQTQSMAKEDPSPLISAIDKALPRINNGYNWVVKVPDLARVFK